MLSLPTHPTPLFPRYHSFLIGPGGSRVRELERLTCTRVSFSGDGDPVVVRRFFFCYLTTIV